MKVIKRDGTSQLVNLDKITERIRNLTNDLKLDPVVISIKIIEHLHDGIHTRELDELAAQICIELSTENLEYGILASRIIISNNHKETSSSFSEVIEQLYNNVDECGEKKPLISKKLYKIVQKYKLKLNDILKYERDYDFDYFAFKTLEKAYLFKVKGKIVERIQHMFLRVSLGLYLKMNSTNIGYAIESYNLMSQKKFIHASPTLYHSGTEKPSFLSCFLLGTDDSINGMYKTMTDCAKISKNAGGIGIHISNIRSSGGKANGIVPMLRVYNNIAKHVNQSGKRPGAFAFYLEPHHPEILQFLDLRKNNGSEELRARSIFTALWVSDLFMKRVYNDEDWSLFDPNICKGLTDVYGKEYEKLYLEYENKGLAKHVIKANKIYKAIVSSQIETGTPYIGFKDHVNRKTNQKNLGVIKSSNLCIEICEYSDSKEYACCCLSSVCLPSYIKPKKYRKVKVYTKTDCKYCKLFKKEILEHEIVETEIIVLDDDEERQKFYKENNCNSVPQIFIDDEYIGGYTEYMRDYDKYYFDHEELISVCKVVVRNLNKIIDLNYYAVPETKRSNLKHRPLGIGVQGLADVYLKMGYAFDSEKANKLNIEIFETLYYGALKASMEQALKEGQYSSFKGSPLSKGLFQFDLWNEKPTERYDWNKLREEIKENGVRNSLLIALMPTASTSQIMGNNECIEPYTSNIYVRNTIAGSFIVINKHLVKELTELGLWNKKTKDTIIFDDGSVKLLDIPEYIKEKYKTAWELKQKVLINQSADRGKYICQTQSLNLFFRNVTENRLKKAMMYSWKKGLKTGNYYIRTQSSKTKTQQFTIDPELALKLKEKQNKYEVCESCSG